jgi:hypothetical protein
VLRPERIGNLASPVSALVMEEPRWGTEEMLNNGS